MIIILSLWYLEARYHISRQTLKKTTMLGKLFKICIESWHLSCSHKPKCNKEICPSKCSLLNYTAFFSSPVYFFAKFYWLLGIAILNSSFWGFSANTNQWTFQEFLYSKFRSHRVLEVILILKLFLKKSFILLCNEALSKITKNSMPFSFRNLFYLYLHFYLVTMKLHSESWLSFRHAVFQH